MNRKEFVENLRKTFENCLNIVKSKNADYAETTDGTFVQVSK